MNPIEGYERVPSDGAVDLLKQVLQFRETCQQLEKPEDVNHLLGLFPLVGLREGYMLDYIQTNIGEMASGIQPFARARDSDDTLIGWFDDEQEQQDQEIEQLYQYLLFDSSAESLFQYAFFVTELQSTRASWQVSDWIASTPVFSAAAFDHIVEEANKVDSLKRPEWYGPLVSREEGGGRVKFLVHTSMTWERIYYLDSQILPSGLVKHEAGEIIADFGHGIML